MMKVNRMVLAASVATAVFAFSSAVSSSAQTAGSGYLTPRTEFGAPDLQGVVDSNPDEPRARRAF